MSANRSLVAKARRKIRHKIIYGLRHRRGFQWLYPARWHAALSGGGKADTPRHYLTARPNPGAGIGHQLGNWIAGYHYAEFLGCTYAHSPFPDTKWEQLLGFAVGETAAGELAGRGIKTVRLPLFEDGDATQIASIKRIIASYRRPVLFLLEDDQFFRAQYPAAPALSEKFMRANPQAFARPLATSPLRIAVHVRRGDVDAASTNPNILMRWMDAAYFVRVLEQLVTALAGHPAQFELFSQGRSDDFADLEKIASIRFRTDDGPLESFRDMASADVLVTSKSSFSYKPALLARGLRIVPGNFWHGYPDDPLWVRADDAGQIDRQVLAQGIAALLTKAGTS